MQKESLVKNIEIKSCEIYNWRDILTKFPQLSKLEGADNIGRTKTLMAFDHVRLSFPHMSVLRRLWLARLARRIATAAGWHGRPSNFSHSVFLLPEGVEVQI